MIGSVEVLDGDDLARNNTMADIAVISFSKAEVMEAAIGDALDRLLHFSDNAAAALHYRGRMLWQFEGWDGDPREVYEIPECRAFFHAVTAEWPFWFHYHMPTEHLLYTIFMLSDVCKVVTPDGGVGARLLNLRQVDALCDQLDTAVGLLHKEHSLPADLHELIMEEVAHCLRLLYR